jgi:multidrug transporter EmrE-like cation transporter
MILVGLNWTFFGIVMGKAPGQKMNVSILICFSAALAFAMSFGLGLALGFPVCGLRVTALVFIPLFLCGIFNYIQLTQMSKAMRNGPNGVIWNITQTAFAFPFLAGILFFGVRLTWWRGLGFLAITLALILFALGKTECSSGPWKARAFLAFALTGAAQTLSNLPSYFPEAEIINSVWRAAFFSIGLAAPMSFAAFSGGGSFSAELSAHLKRKAVWGYCLIMQGFELPVSLLLLYPGMNLLAEAGAGAIAYPLMVASSLIGFELYSIIFLMEKRSLAQRPALPLCLA